MPLDEAALAAAVDKGIADAAPAAPAAIQEPSAQEGDDHELDAPEGNEPAGEGAEGAADAGDGGVAAVDGDSPPGDGSAQPVGGVVPPGAPKVVLGEDGKPIVPPGDPAAAKVPDPLNDPLPNALKKETKERITTLVGMVKETSGKLESALADRNDILGAITSTGATPTQYKQSLDYLRLVNSPSREDKKKALEMMQGEIRALATMLGEPVPGVNFLEGHADLIEAVGTGRITHQHAMELAAARASKQRVSEVEASQAQQQQAQNGYAQQVAQARADMNALGHRLKANDPHFNHRMSVIAKTFPAVIKHLHPTRWLVALEEAYNSVPAPAEPQPRATTPHSGQPPAGGGGNTPLRANNPAGGQRPAPKNLAEAIDFGIRDAR